MARSIKLTWASSRYILGQDDGIRLRLVASCADNMPSKIFAYRMLPLNPQGVQLGHFSHICSPVDLEEYPEDEPCPGHAPEWFRLDVVDVLVRSTEEAANFLAIIRDDVQRIIWTLNRMDMLFYGGEAAYGTPDCPSSSESLSASLSASSESSSSSGSV
jgi:hypothetical protein